MNMTKLVAVILIFVSSAQTFSAPPTNEDLIRACDRALSDCDKALAASEALNKGQAELLLESRKRIEKLEGEKSSLLNSKVLWFALGAIGMGYAARAFAPK
jgi:hypothetical protein